MKKNFQKTINDSIKFYGVGLHNRKNVNLTINPADENFGIKFRRTDLNNGDLIDVCCLCSLKLFLLNVKFAKYLNAK